MKLLLMVSLFLNFYLLFTLNHKFENKTNQIRNDQLSIKQSSLRKKIIQEPNVACPEVTVKKAAPNIQPEEFEKKIEAINSHFEESLEEHFVSHNIDVSKLNEYKTLKADFENQQSEIWKNSQELDDSIFSPYREKELATLRIKYMKKLQDALGADDYLLVHQFIESFNKEQLEAQDKDPSTPVVLIGF